MQFEFGHNFSSAGDFTNNGGIRIGAGSRNGNPIDTTFTVNGNLTNYDSGTHTLSGGFYGLEGREAATATLRFADADIHFISATVEMSGDSQITDLAGNNAFRNLAGNSGTTQLSGNFTITPSGGTFSNTGTFAISSGASISVSGNYSQTGGSTTVSNGGSFSASGTYYTDSGITALGTTFGSGPAATVASAGGGFTVTNFSQLTGTGTAFGDLTFTADSSFMPGHSAGQVNLEGNLTMDSTCVFGMEIGGTSAGEEFDLIAQTGAFTINLGDSTLAVSLISGFENSITGSDTFNIITSDNPIVGSFGNVSSGTRLTTSDGLGSFLVTYSGQNEVTLSNYQAVLSLTAAVSRKMHGALGPFDVPLPLTGAPGVECRSSGGNHTLVFTFTNDVVSGDAEVTGVGSVSGSPTFFANTMTVSLIGVADVQQIAVTLTSVTDSFAQVLPDATVNVKMLIGDTTGNASVGAGDIGQTKGQAGATVSQANCRQDVTPNGSINASDIGVVKSRSGQSVP